MKTQDSAPSQQHSLPETTVEQIMELIQKLELKEGDQLPNEFELAKQLNVGRSTVREAVKQLTARGILEIRRGRGTFVAQKPGEIPDPLGFSFRKDQFRLAEELMELRRHVEPWVAEMAALRATDEEIEELRRYCILVENEILEGRNHLDIDTEFHTCIAHCMHNLAVARLIPIISYSVRLFGTLTKNSLRSETIIDHRAILDAIANHDPKRARAAMEKHMNLNELRLREFQALQQTQE